MTSFFHQTFEPHDLLIVALLIVLEGVLSIDNALVLGLLAKRLPKSLQRKALTYGLIGAFVFRFLAIATAAWLLQWRIVKLLGGGYLLYVAIKHFIFGGNDESHARLEVDESGHPAIIEAETRATPAEPAGSASAGAIPAARLSPVELKRARGRAFWSAVIVIELTDIAFAVDSIVAALGLVATAPADHPADAPHPKLWVILLGGMAGVILMRFAAILFIKLLEKFPRFETSAYLLVIVIGGKLVIDWMFNSKENPHRMDFHNYVDPAFWVFWILMLLCFVVGFVPRKSADARG
ncbi:MAG TPA: hypothetical protein VIL86_00380 [Tepidisphaeraceae bacterium]|jgi:YkoY family integral membrane protein